jgi:hypothetical protein
VRSPRTTFRLIVVAQALLGLLAGWQSLAGRTDLPAPLQQYALTQPPPAGAELWLGLIFILLSIITTVGAFMFWPPARPLWAGSMVLAFVAAPFLPPAVQTSLASALQSAAVGLTGLAIGLMYFAPNVAAQFERVGTTVSQTLTPEDRG